MKRVRPPRPKNSLLCNARRRARDQDVPFSLSENDLHIPEECPCCGVGMKSGYEDGINNSPSIDRIIPELGYVSENIVIIDHRCNRRKSDSTPEQLYEIADFVYAVRKERGLDKYARPRGKNRR